MPGVPSGRGCDACRKQKKKCYTTGPTPPCSRCRRLGITCAGFGRQRFKFKDESRRLTLANESSNTACKDDIGNCKGIVIAAAPSYGLANGLTRLTSAFVSNLDPSTDISIQLTWNFGEFLCDVPRRLGTNEALDAASEALVSSYAHFLAGGVGVAPDVLLKHSKALNALRQCLDDPVKAYSSETLCSIMILMIVQYFSFPDSNLSISHSVGVAEILKGRGYTGPKDEFESKLLSTLRSVVVVEALYNSRVSMSQRQWADLVYSPIDIDTIDGQMMKCLAHLPDLIQRGRCALKQPVLFDSVLLELQREVRNLHGNYAPILKSIRERLERMNSRGLSQHPGPDCLEKKIHAYFTRSYGMALAVGIVLNCILIALVGTNPQLSQESSQFSDEILALAEVVNQYRPLGASYMILCLGVAWLGATDPKVKAKTAECLFDYQRDLRRPIAAFPSAYLELLEKRVSLK